MNTTEPTAQEIEEGAHIVCSEQECVWDECGVALKTAFRLQARLNRHRAEIKRLTESVERFTGVLEHRNGMIANLQAECALQHEALIAFKEHEHTKFASCSCETRLERALSKSSIAAYQAWVKGMEDCLIGIKLWPGSNNGNIVFGEMHSLREQITAALKRD